MEKDFEAKEVEKIIDDFSAAFETQIVEVFQPKPGEDNLPYTIEIAERIFKTTLSIMLPCIERLDELKTRLKND